MKTLDQSRENECRFCERTAEAVVDAGGAMVTLRRCNRRDCMVAFEQERRRDQARAVHEVLRRQGGKSGGRRTRKKGGVLA